MDGEGRAAPQLSPHLLNPVGRVWALLVSVRTRGSPDAPAHVAVGDHVGLEPGVSPVLYLALAAVLRLPAGARAAIAASDPPAALAPAAIASALAEAEQAVEILGRPTALIRSVREGYGDDALATLKGASAALIGTGAPTGSGAALERIRVLASVLRAAGDSAPQPLSGFLVDHATGVLDAVRLFPLTGPGGLADEAGRLVGRLSLRPDIRTVLADSPGSERLVRDLLGRLEAFAALPK